MYWGFTFWEQTGAEPQNSAQALIQCPTKHMVRTNKMRKREVRDITKSLKQNLTLFLLFEAM